MDKPQVKRVVESAPETAQARVEQIANKAADAVHTAGDRVAPNAAAAPAAPGGSAPAAGRTAKGRSKST
jgi:hypothetical protein